MAVYEDLKQLRNSLRPGDRRFAAALDMNRTGTRCLKDLEPILVELCCSRKEGMDQWMRGKGYGPSLLVPVIDGKPMYRLAMQPSRIQLFQTKRQAWEWYLSALEECRALNKKALDTCQDTKAYLDELHRNCRRITDADTDANIGEDK